jgi:hypothetical protein
MTPLRTQQDLQECLDRIARLNAMQAQRERGVWMMRAAVWVAGTMVFALVLILLRAVGAA